jgi:virginiamycin A acetyltransferase
MFLRNAKLPVNVAVGEYTYYDDPEGPEAFARNVLYHFEFTGDRLIIGKFCAIAMGVKFIMNGANHRMTGLSTYPFQIFDAWRGKFEGEMEFAGRGDVVVGNDVWIGYDAVIMPGVKIGSGAVIGARSVVTRDIPAYAVAAGNPARVIRMRFDEGTIKRLLELRWWDWDAARISRNIRALSVGRLEDLAE